ncbi:TIGR01841 family phasin [Novosphingobium sp. G106]|uniref:phasin family protein n=1 Tax=Novosphingobium sp. G106 TaxID=2849500 RepID=UPI001C2D9A9E|nr:phasin family protein [Novosphingobium sp. G106]MBV1690563.1 TIGR01841 family phasin [Novosphingobium sp. G106]
MADSDVTKIDDSAEKAYAAASEAIVAKELPEAETPAETEVESDAGAEPVEFPAKPKRARKPAEPVAVAPVVEALPAAKPASKPRAAKPIKAPIKVGTPAPKLAVKRGAAKSVTAAPAKSAPIKPRKASVQKIKTAPKTASPVKKASPSAAPSTPFFAKIKEIPMDVTASIKDTVNGAQEKAKEAFAKTTAAATEATEFAKGNVEAFVESGKILASGLQELGNKFVADSKSAFETATTDVKALSAVKSPTEFFKFQTDLLRRNFDTAVAYSTKTGEAMVKLSGDVIKPLSGRVSLALDKVKAAA